MGLPTRARLAVIAFFMIHGLVFASWLVRIPDIKAQLHLTDGQLGFALLSAPVGAFTGQVLVGWLLPRWGSRRLAAILAVLWFAEFPLLGLAPNLLVLVPVLGLYGLLSAGVDVAMNAQAALVEQAYGRPIMSSFHGVWSVAGLGAAALGGFLAGQGMPVGVHFLVVAGVALAGGAVAQRGLLVVPPPPAADTPPFALLPATLVPLGGLTFGVLLCEGAIGDWSSVYLRETLHSPPALAAGGYVIFALLMTVGRLLGDWLTLRLGPARIVRGGGLLVIAASAWWCWGR
jgi:MFS family permease